MSRIPSYNIIIRLNIIRFDQLIARRCREQFRVVY